jgi:hypothetical protein
MAYRSRKDKAGVAAATEGLVADMVRQFADPFAFVRELVQNGIDAGASALTVRADHRDGTAVFSVADDGCGMTREIIEGPLLTLFSSSKDGDLGKIGKYGVGFVSVFAIEPEAVTVETWREEGGYLLTLLPDHTYQLARQARPRSSASGTVVSLKKALAREQFEEEAAGMRSSLARWCRHARLPIHFVKDTVSERVDTPLAVVTAHMVRVELDAMTIVLGPSAGSAGGIGAEDGESFAGFYCHGLTLFETQTAPLPELAGIRFKVDSRHLSHTLSRDNVRHDEAYYAALRRVAELTRGWLARDFVRRVAEEANAASAAHAKLVLGACTPALRIDADDLVLPLAAPLRDGTRTLRASQIVAGGTLLYSETPSPLADALAAKGRAVWLAAEDDVVETLVRRIGCAAQPLWNGFLLVTPEDDAKLTPAMRALLDELGRALDRAGYAVPALAFAYVRGAGSLRAAYGVEALTTCVLEVTPGAGRWSKRRLSRLPLAISLKHEAVDAARRRARDDARTAGGLLARYLLCEELGEVPKNASDALVAAAGSDA